MIKLYKKARGRVMRYHEAWVNGAKIVEHWGKVGERGESRNLRVDRSLGEDENLARVLAKAAEEGFAPVDLDDHAMLMVEYAVEGHGSSRDVRKIAGLERELNELLGWTGLGHCDGHSIGSGTMEAACFVVDFKVAKKVVSIALEGTKYEGFSRLYDERA